MEKDSIIQMLINSPELAGMIVESVKIGLDEYYFDKEKPAFYTELEACELLRITKQTLYKYRRQGIIKASRVGKRNLYSPENIQAAIVKIPANYLGRGQKPKK